MAVVINGNRRLKVYLKTNGHCWYCGVDVSMEAGPSQFTVDHVEPTNLGGSDDIYNLVPSCRGCNTAKGDRSYEAFRQKLAWKHAGCEPLTNSQLEYLVDKGVVPNSIIPPRVPFPGEIKTYGPDGWEDGLSLDDVQVQDAMYRDGVEDSELWDTLVHDIGLAMRSVRRIHEVDPDSLLHAIWEGSAASCLWGNVHFFRTGMNETQADRFAKAPMPFGIYEGMPLHQVPLEYLRRCLRRLSFLHKLETYVLSLREEAVPAISEHHADAVVEAANESSPHHE